jgi:guanosine-3',5'-bis(diphosphate) 3'-pyrophosphohydrolase
VEAHPDLPVGRDPEAAPEPSHPASPVPQLDADGVGAGEEGELLAQQVGGGALGEAPDHPVDDLVVVRGPHLDLGLTDGPMSREGQGQARILRRLAEDVQAEDDQERDGGEGQEAAPDAVGHGGHEGSLPLPDPGGYGPHAPPILVTRGGGCILVSSGFALVPQGSTVSTPAAEGSTSPPAHRPSGSGEVEIGPQGPPADATTGPNGVRQDAEGAAAAPPPEGPAAGDVGPDPEDVARRARLEDPRLAPILAQVREYQPNVDVDFLADAFFYAEAMHDGQLRKSGDPYFVHPTSVAAVIAEMKLDASSVAAAFMHDVVEDTEATLEDIEERFGEEVAFLVDGVTKLGRINFNNKEDQQAESFRKMLVAMARDIRVLVVKLCDRLDNMRTLDHMKDESRERISRETLDIYAPLAGRLGIFWLKSELEDLSFKYLWPEHFAEVSRQVKRASRDRDKYITDVTRRLNSMLIERGFAVEVAGRVKHKYSLWRKMRKNNCEFEQVHDYVAFRCIMETVADCYAALGVVHSQWTPIPGRFKDYIALPKPNLYQSLHTTVIGPGQRRIEVQIRTHEMHRTAEFGIAAHWKYKPGGLQRSGGLDAKDAAQFAWLRQLMEFQKDVADPAEFLDSVKVDLFTDEVYVFTPMGELKVFPRGATPVDFAYAVHTEVGQRCSGARVNGAIVPLRYKLRNGDTVEILTSPKQNPSKDWLDFVATGRARSKIRNYLRAEERKQAVKLGKELMERAFHKKDVSFSRFLKKKDEVDRTVRSFKIQALEELYALIGYGKLDAEQVYDVAFPSETESRELRPSFFERATRTITGKNWRSGIRIDDTDDVMVRFARCCSPLPGDPITGWITRGRGVTVHRRGCPRAMELDPERRIDVSWSEVVKVDRPVSLRVDTADRPGILSDVSAIFTDSGVNIHEANCRVDGDGRAINVFQFAVNDAGKLRSLMRRISAIEGVYDVQRN